jgi:group I intron endonuclease
MKTIYKATNTINGKCYVGHDSNWPYRRTAHKSAAKRGSDCAFHRAIRKYGWDAFEWEIVEQSEEDNSILLTEREEFYIRKFNSHYIDGHGYNMTYGGEATLGWVPTEETKNRISESKKGKPSGRKGMASPWVSKMNTERKGSISINRRKLYEFIDPDGNEYVEKGLKQFCKRFNLDPSNMAAVANGRLKHYKQWTCKKLDK